MVLPALVVARRAAVIARIAAAIIAIAANAAPRPAGAQTCAPASGGPTCEIATGVASLGDSDGSDLTVGNPIHPLTGNKYQDETDAAPLPGALGLEIRRHYHSNYVADDAVWGRGWRLSYDTQLFRTGDRIQIVQADGRRLLFGAPAGEPPIAAPGVACPSWQGGQGELLQAADGYYWTWPDRRELRFDRDGRLVRIAPAAGGDREAVLITRDAHGRIAEVTDPAGRRMTIEYDSAGRLEQIVHPLGRWRYRVGPEGQLQSTTGPDDVTRRYAYDDLGRRTRITAITVAVGGGPPRLVGRWSYDADGRAIRHVRADGTTLELSYDTKPGGARVATLFDGLGRKTRYEAVAVAGRWRPTEIIGPGCEECGPTNLRMRYDRHGRLIARWIIGGDGVGYVRDPHGRLIELRRLVGPDRAGMVPGIDPSGAVVDPPVPDHRPMRPPARAPGASVAATIKTSDPPSALTPLSTADPWMVRFAYADGTSVLPVVIDRPSVVPGHVRRLVIERDPRGRPLRSIETGYAPIIEPSAPDRDRARPQRIALGGTPAPNARRLERRIEWRYRDVGGRSLLEAIDGPLPNGPSRSSADSDIVEIEADADSGLPAGARLPGGITIRVLERDAGGRPVRVSAEDGYRRVIESLDRDHRGNWTTLRRTGWLLDERGGIRRESEVATIEHRRFDEYGHLTEQSDAAGRLLRHRHDARGRRVESGDARGYRVVRRHDAEGRMVRLGLHEPSRDDPIRATYLRYGTDGRLAAVLEPDGRLTRVIVDGNGSVLGRFDGQSARLTASAGPAMTSALGIDLGVDGLVRIDRRDPVAIVVDDFGRRIAERLPDHGLRTIDYDEGGRIASATDGAGVTIRFEHDAAGRLRRTLDVRDEVLATHLYEGRWVSGVDDPRQSRRFVRDGLGRITETRTAFAGLPGRWYVVANGIDAGSELVRRRTLADGSTVLLDRRPAAEGATVRGVRLRTPVWSAVEAALARVLPKGASVALTDRLPTHTVVDEIDVHPFDGVTAIRLGNGVRATRRFDAIGRTTALHVAGRESVIESLRYRYPQGRRIAIVERQPDAMSTAMPVSGYRYGYDSFGRLRTATLAMPGPASPPSATDAQTADGPVAIEQSAIAGLPSVPPSAERVGRTYDAAGRLVRDRRFRYRYTMHGQLAEVRRGDGDRVVGGYGYNDSRERVSKTVVDERGATLTRYFLWSDGRIAAEIDAEGAIRRQYLYLDDGHRSLPVAALDHGPGHSHGAGAIVTYFHVDHRGAPLAVSDDRAKVLWRAALSPNGSAHSFAVPGSGDRPGWHPPSLRLPGQYFDAESGLHDNGHRTYDPEAGRYLQPDPLGYPDGPDPYAYAGGDPINRIDPVGLYELDVHYYMTFFLSVTAGRAPVEARAIASAAQYVDENPLTRPVNNRNPLTTVVSPFANQPQLIRYHFVLSGDDGRTRPEYLNDRLDHPDGHQLGLLWEAAQRAELSRPGRLVLLGEYLHALADTYSHRDHLDVPIDAWFAGCGLGHGLHGHQPDYTYDDTDPGHGGGGADRLPWRREERTLRMEAAVFTRLSGETISGRAVDWTRIEPYLREFNAVRENDSTGFTGKIQVLNRALAELGYVGVRVGVRSAEDRTAAAAARDALNREVDRFDPDGSRFPGVCFPDGPGCNAF